MTDTPMKKTRSTPSTLEKRVARWLKSQHLINFFVLHRDTLAPSGIGQPQDLEKVGKTNTAQRTEPYPAIHEARFSAEQIDRVCGGIATGF